MASTFNANHFYHYTPINYPEAFIELVDNNKLIEVEIIGTDGKFRVEKVIVDKNNQYFKDFKTEFLKGLSGNIELYAKKNQHKNIMLTILKTEFKNVKEPYMFKGECTFNSKTYIVFFPWTRVIKQQISQGGKNTNINASGKDFNDAVELATIESLKYKPGNYSQIKKDNIIKQKLHEFSRFDTNQDIFIKNQQLFDSWKDTFDNTKKLLQKELKRPARYYDIVHDGSSKSNGIAKLVQKISKDIFKRSSKDAYNPADIYILHEKNVVDKIGKALKHLNKNVNDDDIKKQAMNNLLYNLYQNDLYYPVSLKKLNGSGQLKKYNPPKQRIPVYVLRELKSKCKLDCSSQEIGAVSITVDEYDPLSKSKMQKTFKMQMRMFGSSDVSSLIQLEVTSDGAKTFGRVGKIPKDIIVAQMRKYTESMNLADILSKYDWFGKNNESNGYIKHLYTNKGEKNKKVEFLYKVYRYVKMYGNRGVFKLSFSENISSLQNFQELINKTFTGDKKQDDIQKKLCGQLQGLLYLYFFVVNGKRIHKIITTLFNGAQRLGANNGFFIKVF